MIMHLVITRIEHQHYGLPSASVVELIRCDLTSATALPGSRLPALGVMPHRGHCVTVLDGRALLGLPSFQQELEELKELLHQCEQDHLDWLSELRRCCETGSRFTKATNPHECAFGRWYDALTATPESIHAFTGGDPDLDYLVRCFQMPHARIHGIAEQALACAGEGNTDEANAIIQNAWDTDLAELRHLFQRVLEDVAVQRRPTAVVMRLGTANSAILVDEVDSVVTLGEDEVQSIGLDCQGGSCVKGMCPDVNGKPVMLLDLDTIADRLGASAMATA